MWFAVQATRAVSGGGPRLTPADKLVELEVTRVREWMNARPWIAEADADHVETRQQPSRHATGLADA